MDTDEILKLFFEENVPFSKICSKFNLTKEDLIKLFEDNEYFYINESQKKHASTILKFKQAADEFINLTCDNTTFTTISKKYGLNSQRFKNYLIKYYPNIKLKKDFYFDDTVFDEIDTEEKAYWLGFIYADGYISSSPLDETKKNDFQFELALSLKDINHLKKCKFFFGFKKELIVDDYRCRLECRSQHLWNTLNNYGCTPRKSLTLKFPDIKIFKSPNLIFDFIRGYVDGDGSLTYSNKEHTYPEISIIGTTDFLNGIMNIINYKSTIHILHKEKPDGAKVIFFYGNTAYKIAKLLYEKASIYLDRKYEKYYEYCRLYEESYRELGTNIGESCDANPEINSEIKESESSYSVETETEKSE